MTTPSTSSPPDVEDDEALRARSVVLLGEAVEDDTPLFDVARAIEEAVRARGRATYRADVRRLTANLKRNATLARDVRAGVVDAETLVAMSTLDLATEEAKEARARMLDAATRRRTRKQFDDGINSEAYTCPQCSNNECKYVMLSDTRDIRKAEIWGGGDEACLALVQCQRCQFEWRETVL